MFAFYYLELIVIALNFEFELYLLHATIQLTNVPI